MFGKLKLFWLHAVEVWISRLLRLPNPGIEVALLSPVRDLRKGQSVSEEVNVKSFALFVLLVFLATGYSFVAAGGQAERSRAGYEHWIPSSTVDTAEYHGIHFIRFENGSARMPKYPFRFQRWDEPQLKVLNRRLGVDELVADASSELEAAARVARMVCNLWNHSVPVEYPLWNALDILDMWERGNPLWCTYKQLVTMQCLASIGIHSRIIPCHYHHSLEFWSNEWGKWVVMDAWTANYYQKDGVPQGALDLHRLSRISPDLKGMGVWEINVNPNRWFPDRVEDRVPAVNNCYIHIRYIARNNFLSEPLAPKAQGNPGSYRQLNNQLNDVTQSGLMHVSWWQPGDPPPLVGPMVTDEQDFDFPLNEVEADVRRPLDAEGVLELALSTHTPEFDTYLKRLDSRDWERCGERILWKLNRGRNLLEIKSRNKWGRSGPVTLFELDYKPEELREELVDKIQVPNAGFESSDDPGKLQAQGWKMIYRDEFQKPEFYGRVNENPHSGSHCFNIKINQSGHWAKLFSSRFRVNQASDVSLRVWLRASQTETPVKVFIEDATRNGPGREGFLVGDYTVGTDWTECLLKARLSTRTSEVVVGVLGIEGTLWVDDFSVTEDARAVLP
jgi:hypothetical protein